jgi:transposase
VVTVLIGVDPHKATHTAAALNPGTNKTIETTRIEATLPEYRRLLAWAKRFPERCWAVENAWGLGRHLAQWLIAHGETVTDVPSTATARVRELSRGGRRKNDNIDAAAAASVAALHGDAAPVEAEGVSTVLRMLDERRTNLTRQRTRTVNQATDVLRRVRPSAPVERARKELARELVADVRALDARLKANQQRMQDTVTDSGSSLLDVVGVGPVVAARLLGRTGRASRFRTAGAFAVHTGTAPIEIASAGKSRHRLSRHGDRQLNNALHTIALTQVRMPGTRGRIYYDGKVAEGKGHKEAMR